MSGSDVIIVGGGLAGLGCANRLHAAGVKFLILESSDRVGGRVGTDLVDGFLLDRGFQVLLTAYPEAQRVLNYEQLKLRRFEPGALIRYRGQFHRLVDPWRRPAHLLATAFSPLGSLADKLRMARLRRQLSYAEPLDDRPESSTIARLHAEGFSDRIIESFFRPFLGGVFLERELATSSRKFEFVFRMFSTGDAALPDAGMQAIPQQLAAALPPDSIRTNISVKHVDFDRVVLRNGDTLHAKAVVLAADAAASSRLLDPARETPTFNDVTCLYFAAKRPPLEEPILVLNGEGSGPINNLCVPSQIAPSYAPEGMSLISVTVLGHLAADELPGVRQQLHEWFGSDTDGWRLIKRLHIPHALPRQPSLRSEAGDAARGDKIFRCGDYLDLASIQGALASGRAAADSVIATI